MVDGGLQQHAVLVHAEPGGAEGDGQGQLAPVGHAGVRIGEIPQGLVHAVEGGDGGVGVGGAHIGLGHRGPLVVVGHEDHLVGSLPDAPVVPAVVPGVGLDADVQALVRGQGGAQLGEEGDEAGAGVRALQGLKVDGNPRVVRRGGHQGGHGLGPPGRIAHHPVHGGDRAAVGEGDGIPVGGVYIEVVGDAPALPIAGGGGGVGGHHPVVVVGAGGVEPRPAGRIQLHPGPAHADGVHGGGQVDLGVGGEGVEPVEPVHAAGVPLIHPHQHGGGLLPGGGVVGEELELAARPLHAGDHADVVGDGDIALVLRHVVKGEGQVGELAGQLVVPQGPHQHDGHLLPADVVLRPEGAAGVHDAVGQGGLHIGVGPVGGGAVGEGGALRRHRVPGEHPAQHGDELHPGELPAHAEGAVGVALHQSVFLHLLDHVRGPAALGVGKGGVGGGGEGGGGKQQHGGQGRRAEPARHGNHMQDLLCSVIWNHQHCTKNRHGVQPKNRMHKSGGRSLGISSV